MQHSGLYCHRWRWCYAACILSVTGGYLWKYLALKGCSDSQDRPHDPLGKTMGSFFAPLLTSLSLCGVKIQSCILLSGQTAAGVQHLCCNGGEWMREQSEQLPPGNTWIQTTKTWWVTPSMFEYSNISNNMLFSAVCAIFCKTEIMSVLYFQSIWVFSARMILFVVESS